MTTHKIIIRKYSNKSKDYLDIAAESHGIALGALVVPERREKGIEMIQNSIAALETYGEKIITTIDSNYNPRNPWLYRIKKLFKKEHGYGCRTIDPRKIPKDFNKEIAKSKLTFEINEL